MKALIFDKPSDALAAIPPDGQFRLRSSVGGIGGRREIPGPDGPNWTPAAFKAALADETLPRQRYIIKPVVAGKVLSKRIQLDLNMSEESLTVGDGSPSMEEQAQLAAPASGGGSAFVQESVVGALIANMQEERAEVYDLRDEIREKTDEICELKLRVQALEHQLETAGQNDSMAGMLNKAVIELMKGPAAGIFATKLLGAGGEAVAAAMRG